MVRERKFLIENFSKILSLRSHGLRGPSYIWRDRVDPDTGSA